jgi:hypothetical protein
MNLDYWKKQAKTPLFENIAWNQPEQKSLGGRLAIIGGSRSGFSAISLGLKVAENFGAGEARVLLPDVLQKILPSSPNIVFTDSNPSGGFAKTAAIDMVALADWADAVAVLGDLGKSPETALALKAFLKKNHRPLTIMRDAVDLALPVASEIIAHDQNTLIVTLAQLQKLFREVYYPKVVTFSMPLAQIVEALHKFTLSYPLTIATFHQGSFLVAKGGDVISTALSDTRYSVLSLWSGEIAVKTTLYQIWNPKKLLEAAATAVLA